MRRMMGQTKLQVTRSVPATEQEVLDMMALEGYKLNAEKAMGLFRAKAQHFWSQVELRIGEVTSPLQWDEKEGVIKILKEVDAPPGEEGFPD